MENTDPDRFDHIEVGQGSVPPPQASDNPKCAECGTVNEPERARCRGCFKKLPFFVPQGADDQQIEVDGVLYRRNDPQCPEDIRVLMDRVRKEGNSPRLMQEWRTWRSTRHSQGKTSQAPVRTPISHPNDVPPPSNVPYDMQDWTGRRYGRSFSDRTSLIIWAVISLLGIVARIFLWRSYR